MRNKAEGNLYLIFPVIFLTEPENPIAKPKDVFVRSMTGVGEFLNLQ
jgi:hypothetical protein